MSLNVSTAPFWRSTTLCVNWLLFVETLSPVWSHISQFSLSLHKVLMNSTLRYSTEVLSLFNVFCSNHPHPAFHFIPFYWSSTTGKASFRILRRHFCSSNTRNFSYISLRCSLLEIKLCLWNVSVTHHLFHVCVCVCVCDVIQRCTSRMFCLLCF